MKYKIKKEYIKTNLIGFIIAGIIVSGGFVFAAVTFPSNEVSYSNTESGLNSNNVQGAIDELYNTCANKSSTSIGPFDNIPIVTVGDGLYQDEFEECRYLFRGTNPNNYFKINGEEWRIISVECDGTTKVIKTDSIANMLWSQYGENNYWATELKLQIRDYLDNYIHDFWFNGLGQHDLNIGYVDPDNEQLENSIELLVNQEKSGSYQSNIGLITASEYIRANSNIKQCGTLSLNNNNISTCNSTNWLYKPQSTWWTLTPSIRANYQVYSIFTNGSVGLAQAYENRGLGSPRDVYPIIFLANNINVSGTGTSYDPYTLS